MTFYVIVFFGAGLFVGLVIGIGATILVSLWFADQLFRRDELKIRDKNGEWVDNPTSL